MSSHIPKTDVGRYDWRDMQGYKPKGRHQEKRLTAAAVRNLGPGFHGDGNCLFLKVDPSGARRWILRLNVQGKRRDIGLGSAALVSLVEAREAALQHRKAARAGDDPLAAKRRSTGILSFEGAARQVHEERKPTWKNEKHGAQWLATLEKHAFPVLGTKRVDQINSADILAALIPIWTSKKETARRVKQRAGTVLQWAKAQGWRTDDPTEGIEQALPRADRRVKHHDALPYIDVNAAMTKVANSHAYLSTKLAFAMLVHTATRSQEVRKATWGEVDLKKAMWTIPDNRMKTGKAHRVPLTAAALEILERAKEVRNPDADIDLIFPSLTGKALSDATLSKLVRELGIKAVPHGFRSSFRDWAAEQTNHPTQVMEFALAHVIDDKAEKAYARSDLYERRKILMEEWSAYLEKIQPFQ